MVQKGGLLERSKVKKFLSPLLRATRDFLAPLFRFGEEDGNKELVFDMVVLTDKDELIWEDVSLPTVRIFETDSRGLPFRLEMGRHEPVLFVRHGNINSRMIKSYSLDNLVGAIYGQMKRSYLQRKKQTLNPDEEFRELLLADYKTFLKQGQS